jgi:PAS domain S-box-containing protein
MNLRDTPIQKKLMTVILLTCAVALFLMCSAYIILEFFTYRQLSKNNIQTLAHVIASNSTAALAFLSEDDATEILSALRTEEHIKQACLYDKYGNIFATFPADASNSAFPLHPEKNNGFWFKEDYLAGFEPVMQDNKQLGTLYIKSDLEAMYAQMRRYVIIALLLITGSLVIAYILSRLFQKSISEPILALEQTARIISEKHDYSVRAVNQGKDEIGSLTEAFNQMLTQIEMQNLEITGFNQKLENKVSERTYDLQQQKDFIETIINSTVDLVAVFDKDLNYIMLNSRTDDYYSLKREHMLGKNLLEVFPAMAHSDMLKDLNRALKGEIIHDLKYKSPILNRSFENFYIPLKDKQEHIYGVLAIGHDITNLLEANEKLESLNAELLKSNRDLEQFAYVASHDLQEPLRKIQTFTQLMGANLGNEEKLQQYHGKINQAATRMQQLIQDVLNFSRISNSDDAFVDTDLNQVLLNLKIDFELLLREKDATFIHPVLPTIKGIPLQLTQLFSNLISNSLKYTNRKPIININYQKLSKSEVKDLPKLSGMNSYIKILFSDNGIGFDPQFSEQIFNIFQRLHGKQTYSGTGIGLALCKKIVENHHGLIYADGKPGEGATFTIIIPE